MLSLAQRIQVVHGDITQLAVDAIVNAANSSLLGGGGVDGAIHDAAGPELLDECSRLGGCPTGQARLTKGYRLPANYIIHAVGPIYRTGLQGEPALLRSCYEVSLRLAAQHSLRTIAFPCISTGAYGYPRWDACEIATDTVIGWLKNSEIPEQVTFCCYLGQDAELYRKRLAVLLSSVASSRTGSQAVE
jgi:O-acetyl-ADP-ribose deacetylase